MASSAVSVNFKTKGGVKRIVSKIKDEKIQKAIAEDMAHILLDEVNKYVPVNSGKLKNAGYRIKTGTTGISAMSSLSYNNSKKVPYVLYQYYGVVYGPNYATWSGKKSYKRDKYNLKHPKNRIQHIGWTSKKGKGVKYPTNRVLGHPKQNVIHLKNGQEINITGYTKNKNAQAKWLEYVRETPTIWYPLRQKMIKYIEQFYSDKINGDLASRYKK